MPSGRTHRKATAVIQLLSLATLPYTPLTLFIGLQAGFLISYYINPDTDITTERLGPLKHLGFESYKKLIPHRKGLRKKDWKKLKWREWYKTLSFSHSPQGTFPRALWIILLLSVPMLLFQYAPPILFLSGILLSMLVSDLVHIVMDIVWSHVKKRLDIVHYKAANAYRKSIRKKR